MSDKDYFNHETEKYTKPLHRTALISALGAFAFFRCELEGDTKLKYTRVTNGTEIEQALAYIANNGLKIPTVESVKSLPKKLDDLETEFHYFVVEITPPDHRFFESLISRSIGKPVEQVKVEQDVHHFLALAEKGIKKIKEVKEENNGVVYSPYEIFKDI